MNRLIRIYPRAWRERYGEEFEALLEQRPIAVLDVIDIARGGLDARLQRLAHKPAKRGGAMSLNRDSLRDELQAVLAAREELGPDHEPQLVENFLNRLEEHAAFDREKKVRPAPRVLTLWRRSGPLLVLWMLAGISSIAVGFPWSLGSTAAAEVLATSERSGYLAVLIAVLFVFCVASVVCLASTIARYFPRRGQRLWT